MSQYFFSKRPGKIWGEGKYKSLAVNLILSNLWKLVEFSVLCGFLVTSYSESLSTKVKVIYFRTRLVPK